MADTDYTKREVEKRIGDTAEADKAAGMEAGMEAGREAGRGTARKEDSYNYEDIEEELEELV